MSLSLFEYSGQQVRTVLINDEPWFVASDVASVLGYSATAAMTRSMDEDEKGVQILHTPGGDQQVTVISEPGLYDAILRSRVPAAANFKRWVKHDVLPTLRKTGRYGSDAAMLAQLPSSELLMIAAQAAKKAEEAEARAEVAETQVRELAPAAQAWHDIAGADGSWAAREAAQMLCNAGVMIGQNRLLSALDGLGWTFHQGGQRHIKQATIESNLLTYRAYAPRYKPTGERLQVAPQIRVTGKGLDRLVRELANTPALAVVSGGA